MTRAGLASPLASSQPSQSALGMQMMGEGKEEMRETRKQRRTRESGGEERRGKRSLDRERKMGEQTMGGGRGESKCVDFIQIVINMYHLYVSLD